MEVKIPHENFVQLDGNVSIASDDDERTVAPGPRLKIDKIITALNLPTVASYNFCSFFPKVGNFKLLSVLSISHQIQK